MSLRHNLTSAHDLMNEKARLFILKELAAQVDGQLNILSLRDLLEIKYGINRTREWVQTQLNVMEELGAISIVPLDAIVVARIDRSARNHLAQRSVIAGIARPFEAE
ncbi:MAG: hypothetical protein ACK5NN_00275 [Sphingomonadaceae bacterium]